MDPKIKHSVIAIEKLTSRIEFREIDLQFKEKITLDNEYKLLEFIKPFIKSQYYNRYKNASSYIESVIHLPYVRNEVIKNLENRLGWETKEVTLLQKKIKLHNKLPWWKRLKRIK